MTRRSRYWSFWGARSCARLWSLAKGSWGAHGASLGRVGDAFGVAWHGIWRRQAYRERR